MHHAYTRPRLLFLYSPHVSHIKSSKVHLVQGLPVRKRRSSLKERERERGFFTAGLTWLSEYLIMQLCSVVWLIFLCFTPVCPSAEKHLKCRHDRHTQIHQKTHSTKKFCDPSFSNQTEGAITQVCSSLLFVSVAHIYISVFYFLSEMRLGCRLSGNHLMFHLKLF